MANALQTRYAMLTDVGRARARNEDACGADEDSGTYIVCDGMGGAAGGEVASRETAEAFLAEVRQAKLAGNTADALWRAVLRANRAVFDLAVKQPRLRGMGTTLVALQTAPERDSVWVAHVGDSRCYRVRGSEIERLTSDHSVVEEQIRLGELTETEARHSHLRNVITRVMGVHTTVEPEIAEFSCRPGDLFLLCSDGLNRDLSDCDLLSIVQRHRADLDAATRMLISAANHLGGGDNITALLLEIVAVETADEVSVRNDERMSRMSSILRAHLQT